ncbi:MAG TPA: trypsin-like peptidase domain-containing protein [Chloroflexota bacterium]|nr:trypsin-like peptidase domain-containing protein [Chloroflexota bacterium]
MPRLLTLVLVVLLVTCEATESGGIRFGPPTPTAAPKAAAPTAGATAAATATVQPTPTAATVAVAAKETPKPGAAATPAAVESAVTPAAAPPKPSAGTSAIQARLPDVAAVADRVRPAVAFVAVRTGGGRDPSGVQPRQGVGSGAIFDPRGYIVTNNHVVEGGQQIKVVLPDGRDFDAKLIGRDPQSDLAVIKIDGQNLPVARLGDSDKLKVGEWVVAIGNALGLEGGPTVTAGVVSAVKRTVVLPGGTGSIEGTIQTDTAINPGNSGGPLINLNGEIVGINTMVAGQVTPDYQAQGIGFAIAINNAKPIIDELIASGRVTRPWLGVTAMTLTPAIAQQIGVPFVEGVILSEAAQGSPAARAGLRQGDVITALDGQPVKTTDDLGAALARKKVGDRVELTVRRGGQEQKVAVQLGARPAAG